MVCFCISFFYFNTQNLIWKAQVGQPMLSIWGTCPPPLGDALILIGCKRKDNSNHSHWNCCLTKLSHLKEKITQVKRPFNRTVFALQRFFLHFLFSSVLKLNNVFNLFSILFSYITNLIFNRLLKKTKNK